MKKLMTLLYGTVAYATFFGTFVYAIGFVGNLMVPKSIDSGTEGDFGMSLLINVSMLALFAVQHTIMARPGFKEAWTKVVPKAVERSTFVLFASLILILTFWQWRPMTGVVWQVENSVAQAALLTLQIGGWAVMFLATLMIHHFDLFGLRQVYLYARGERYRDLGFRTPGFYKFVRHPIMLGFLIAFWATPAMTVGHLVFAVTTTAYILVGIQFEERDLMRQHDQRYMAYRQQVPALIPTGRSAVGGEQGAPVNVA
jgi:protein-S-isoprenylcysteine O-methyltransferase Ste14